jgi:MFS family permease
MTPARRAVWMGWAIWGLGAAFYLFAYFQRVSPSVMTDSLMREFGVTAASLGNLSAFYFYPYALLQIPLGLMIDRIGPGRLMIGAAVLSAVGAAVFSTTQSLEMAAFGRFLIGAGSSVSWVGALTLAVLWLPPQRFAMVSGLTLLVGLCGAALGQAPLAALIEVVGWRTAILWSAGFIGLVALGMMLLLRQSPAHAPKTVARIGVLQGLKMVAQVRNTWMVSVYTIFMVTPMAAFAGLWGVPYVMEAYGLSRPAAGATMSLMLIGWGIGGPIAGWVSDSLKRRKSVMLSGPVILLAVWSAILGVPDLPLTALRMLLFVGGLFSGVSIINFAITRESNRPEVSGLAMGIINTAGMGASALMLPFIGFLLDLGWDGTMREGVRVYDLATYRGAFLTFAIGMGVAILAGLLLRETHARPMEINGEAAPSR